MPLLSWYKRDDDLTKAARAPYRLLEPEKGLSYGEEDSPNMLIKGDNLEALKALLPYYSGQVNCVYADPPFNTGQAFEDYDDNVEHSKWLSMIYPAMELTKSLLHEAGTLFVHIDDNELAYLTVILDEIMGRKNRIAMVTFKQGAPTGHKSINPGVVNTTNYILIYAKNKSKWKPNRIFTGRERDKRYTQFLLNPQAPLAEWKFKSLGSAFSTFKGKKVTALKKELGPDGYEDELNSFVIQHADHVARTARPDYKAVGAEVRAVIDKSAEQPTEYFLLERKDLLPMYFKAGERIIFYKDKLKEVDGVMVAGEPLTSLWDDLLSNNLHKEGGVKFPRSKKPEALIKRCLELVTREGDLVLDSYLGSGTTAAVAHKMKRRWIGVERGDHAEEKCLPRLRAVVDGDQSGVSKSVSWEKGGGFRFYKLGPPIFDENGHIQKTIRFEHLAAHIWFAETGEARSSKAAKDVFLGEHDSVGYYLLFNGILGDISEKGGNVLTRSVLRKLTPFKGKRVIFGEACNIAPDQLRDLQIVFKQTPYDIQVR